jgi:hypothetical protein
MRYQGDLVQPMPKILNGDLLNFIQIHCQSMLERFPYDLDGGLHNDSQVPTSKSKYGDWHIENLALYLKPQIEEVTGLKLLPTYTFWREYKKGMKLDRHLDREACEVSIALCIARSNKDIPAWDLQAKTKGGTEVTIPTDEGDGMIYNGCEIEHWREPLEFDYHIGAFLHYVDANGIYKSFKNDKRLHTYKPNVR